MPLWQIYHPAEAFADTESKAALAKDITGFYTKFGLPAFYVVINFVKVPDGDMFVGGEPTIGEHPFIRLVINHIAVRLPNDESVYRRTSDGLEKVLKPHIADKGYTWEFHVDETERELWRVSGFRPPPFKSEAEKFWFAQNKAVPYDHIKEKEPKEI